MLLADTADKRLILEALKSPAVAGFTTNPSLMAAAAKAEALPLSRYIADARELCRLPRESGIGRVAHLMIQAVGSAGETLEQAELYKEDLGAGGPRLWIKLIPTEESLSCCAQLKQLGCSTIVTAVFTAAQAFMAMEAGADGVAVYLGRLIRREKDWEEHLARIAEVIREAGKTLLLASFPDCRTVELGLRYSRDLTVPPAVLQELLKSQYSEEAMTTFASKILMSE